MKQNQEENPRLTMSPSFGEDGKISDVDRPQNDPDDDFEFAVAANDLLTDPSVTADEIFSNGRMLPVYPVFNRDLLLAEEKERAPLRNILISDRVGFRSGSTSSSSSSEAEEIEVLTASSYCVWSPRSAPQSPDRCKKSSSTGSRTSRRWSLMDLVIGRSHSDGKEKFVYLTPNPNPNPKLKEKQEKGEKKGKNRNGEKKVTEMDMVTAHRMFYGKNGGQGVSGGRRSYLPYRQELLGLFAPGNGLSRTHHPF